MARRMSSANDAEFDQLKRFTDFFDLHVRGLSPDRATSPAKALDRIVAEHGKSKALTGLRQAVSDCIERTNDRPLEWVVGFDKACIAAGVPTLSQLRAKYSAKYKGVMSRGRIRSQTEYYLVMGILNDLTSDISNSERKSLNGMVAEYEHKAA